MSDRNAGGPPRPEVSVGRRRFLRGTAVGLGGAVAGAGLVRGADADAAVTPSAVGEEANADGPVIPFHGSRQAGILTGKQQSACFLSFDIVSDTHQELVDVMRTLTDRARFLTTGGLPPSLGITAPTADSGILGPRVPADGLTVTVGVGASLFDDRFGLAGRRPRRLRTMPTFPNDDLDPTWCHGDLSLQICADHTDTVLHALRDVARHTRGAMQVRWRMDGFGSPSRPTGTSRNLLGFKDGTANPDVHDRSLMNALTWVGSRSGEPDWAVGGSYQVIRLIRMLVEFWDRVSITEQQRIFGRDKATGAPLDGKREFDAPNYLLDPNGDSMPLDSHIRLANPRTKQTDDQRLLRRSYNYDLGMDSNGNLDMGHVFCCYQQDVRRQFEAVQQRLADEPLVDYVSPFGGGYFFALPGVRDSEDWLGRGLLARQR
jgi:deferrochelatase/peroxidase EfeB